jgi:hypothetical protein
MADEKVTGTLANEWLQNPHQCLFQIETPSTLSEDKAEDSMEAKLEARANRAGFRKSQGEILKYGQEVQLRHIHSNRLLSLNLLNAANAPGAWSVSVNLPSDFLCRQITLLPFNRSHNIGDPIRYGEATSIVFQTDNLKYYLQSNISSPTALDINSTHKPANWKFLRYEGFDEDDDAVKFGQSMTISYSKLLMQMALRPESAQPAGKPSVGGLLKLMTQKGLEAMGGKQSSREVVVTKAEVIDFSNYWILQNVDLLKGGCVSWRSKFHIKNALTGMFLGPNLKLQPKPDPTFFFYFPKPDSFTEESVIPNGYPLMIKSKGEFVLSPDRSQSNLESLDHLVPRNESEGFIRSSDITIALETLSHGQRATLFMLDYVPASESRFFNIINGLIPKFSETTTLVDCFVTTCEASGKKNWEAIEALEKRLAMTLSALDNCNEFMLKAVGEELDCRQKIFTGLGLHKVLIELAVALQKCLDSKAALEQASELIIGPVKDILMAIWDCLRDIVLDNEVSARKVAEHQAHLCQLLKYDTTRIGALLTEVFRLVDPEIKDPKVFFYQWCSRLSNLTTINLQEQIIYMRIIRNLCEIGDEGLVEYQREITRFLFQSEIAINLIEFHQLAGEYAVRFGEKGAAVTYNEFRHKNADLSKVLKENEQGQPVILLRDLSSFDNYVEYLQTALLLYHSIARGRDNRAREYLKSRLNISVETALEITQQTDIHVDIRQSCLFLLEALCISVPPYEAYSDNDTSFSYPDLRLRVVQKTRSRARKLVDYSCGTMEVNQCLEFIFQFWMDKELPAAIQVDETVPAQFLNAMEYLMAMLRVSLAIVEYRHSTDLWAQCVLRAIQYILAGFTKSAARFREHHWGASFIERAIKAGEEPKDHRKADKLSKEESKEQWKARKELEQRGKEERRRLRIMVNELLSCVMNAILAIKKVTRHTVLREIVALFVSQSQKLKNPLFGTSLGQKNSPVELANTLKAIIAPDRSDKLIAEFYREEDRRVIRAKRPSVASIQTAGTEGDANLTKEFDHKIDFKDVVNNAPPLKDIFILVILEWSSFSSTVKDKVIDVMDELFRENRLMDRALQTSDVISLGPISQVYNRLRWIRDNVDFNSLRVRAKFECVMTGKSASLTEIVRTLEYMINFCHPRAKGNALVLEKTQNIVRQLGLHKEVMVLWQLILELDRMGKGNDSPCLQLKGALVSFLFYFVLNNPENSRELSKHLTPDMSALGILQFSSFLRVINDFSHLTIRDITRVMIYLLESLVHSDKDIRGLLFFEKFMIDRTGRLKRNIQNVASSLLSEYLSKMLPQIHERYTVISFLVEFLALSAENNPPVITQCRHILPLSTLQELMLSQGNPMILAATTYFLYAVYVHKPSDSELKTVSKLADVAPVLEHVLKIAVEKMKNPTSLLQLAKEGVYTSIYFTHNPAFVDIHINMPSKTPVLFDWLLLCKEWDGRVMGLCKTLPDLLDKLELDSSIVPSLSRFFYALVECKTKVERMQEQTQDVLSFEPLLLVMEDCVSRCRCILNDLEADLLEEALAVARGDSCELPASVVSELKAVISTSLPFTVDIQALDYLDVDKDMSVVLGTGYDIFVKNVTMEDEEEYIDAIVGLIDFRLTAPEKIREKKEMKELIATLSLKVRGLQKLFTSPKQRTLFFRILKGIVPAEEHFKFKIKLNPLFLDTKLVEYALNSILRDDLHEEVIAAFAFLRKLFLMQSREFMDRFRMILNASALAYPLFLKIQTELNNIKSNILDQAMQSSKPRKEHRRSSLKGIVTTIVKPVKSEELPPRDKLLVKMLKFIQICCDNCNEPFQMFYHEQLNPEGKADVDLVSSLANFLIDIRPVKNYLFDNEGIFKILNAALAALVDFVTGPCSSNQELLGNNVRIYLVMNTLIEECQGKLDENRNEIHQKCIQFLSTLLEGQPHPTVPETMGKFLDLRMLREGCQRIYEQYIKGKEESISLELQTDPAKMGVVEAALAQAILILKMRMMGVAHEELTKFETAYDDTAFSYSYFSKYIGYVEINRRGVLEGHLFPIPWKCKYITPSTKNSLVVDVNRSSHQEKIEDFLHRIVHCKREMIHQQLLYCSKTFKIFSSRWSLFGKIAYYLALLINLLLLTSIKEPDFSDLKEHFLAFTIIAILGMFQCLTYMACFFFNLVEYYPQALLKGIPVPTEFEMDSFPTLENSDSLLMGGVHKTLQSGGEKDYTTQLQTKLKEVLFNFELYYQYSYFLISIIAIYEPVFYPFVLLDMIKQTPELVNVLKSVTQNFRQLVLTLWLGVIIIFLFSIGSFSYYQEYYLEEEGLFCDTLWNCFFSTLNLGIRREGTYMSIPDQPDYSTRMLFDMLFFMIIIIILLNIIFGIIIDTFAELRDQRTHVLDDIHTICYVCGADRSEIEQKCAGWSYHFMCEHSIFAYLSFLVYITDKKIYDCSGLEKHVKECFEKVDASFMPDTSLAMLEAEGKQEKAEEAAEKAAKEARK